jgi:hypothetical protein
MLMAAAAMSSAASSLTGMEEMMSTTALAASMTVFSALQILLIISTFTNLAAPDEGLAGGS